MLESSKKNRDIAAATNYKDDQDPRASSPLFVKRNNNIAPYYREFTSNKQRLINQLDEEKRRKVKESREQQESKDRSYKQFLLKKWEIHRIIEDKKHDMHCQQNKKSFLVITWIASIIR